MKIETTAVDGGSLKKATWPWSGVLRYLEQDHRIYLTLLDKHLARAW